jgi:hypothetical protein
MITTTAYILISTIASHGQFTQSAVTFADKPSCESAAVRQDFVLKSMRFDNELSSNPLQLKWNLTCHPYTLNGESK